MSASWRPPLKFSWCHPRTPVRSPSAR